MDFTVYDLWDLKVNQCFVWACHLCLHDCRVSQARNQHVADSKLATLQPWRWMWHWLPFNDPYGDISQNTEHFITLTVRTSYVIRKTLFRMFSKSNHLNMDTEHEVSTFPIISPYFLKRLRVKAPLTALSVYLCMLAKYYYRMKEMF
jgi:hypothetical protein